MKNILILTTFLFVMGASAAFAQGNTSLGPRDANGVGKLSQDEFLSRPIERFKSMDKNKDGFLSSSELNPAPAAAPQRSAEQKAKMKKRRAEMKAKREAASQ